MTILNKTCDDMRDLVNFLKQELPGWNITWGYIGNIWQSPYRDDRSWHVSMRPEGIMQCWESIDTFSVRHIANDKDHSIYFELNEEAFFNWVERQKLRWNEYMLVNYINRMKGQTEKEVLLNMLARFGYYGKDRYYSDETLYFVFKCKNQFGSDDNYTYAKVEFAFDTKGNLVDVRATS